MGCVQSRTSDSDGVDSTEREGLLPSNGYQGVSDESEYLIQPLPPSPTRDGDPRLPPPLPPSGQPEGGRGESASHGISRVRPGERRPQLINVASMGEQRAGRPPRTDPGLRGGGSGAGGGGVFHVQAAGLPTEAKIQEFADALTDSRFSHASEAEGAAPGEEAVTTVRGKEVLSHLKAARGWRERFAHPSQDFLSLMDRLYMDCQLHLTALSSRGNVESRREADALVSEMMALRDHWGPQLLPNSVCNAFVRERIPLTLGSNQRQFRIDCAQFFEAVPFYNNQHDNRGELMKLYRFSVYDVAKNEVVLRYYLERSNVVQLYHVLCFTCENYRGQVHPYGSEPPSYWEVRRHMLEDVYSRLLSALSCGTHPAPHPHAATIFPTERNGPVIIHVNPTVVAGQKQ